MKKLLIIGCMLTVLTGSGFAAETANLSIDYSYINANAYYIKCTNGTTYKILPSHKNYFVLVSTIQHLHKYPNTSFLFDVNSSNEIQVIKMWSN